MGEVKTHNCWLVGCLGKLVENIVLINCKPPYLLFPWFKSTQKEWQSLLLITKCPWNVNHRAGCCQAHSFSRTSHLFINLQRWYWTSTVESWGQGALPEWVCSTQESRDATGNHTQLYHYVPRRTCGLTRQAGAGRCVGGKLFQGKEKAYIGP